MTRPKIWQVFRPGFLVFFALMVVFGQTLSSYAIGKYAWLITMGIVDLSLAAALLGSSFVFLQHQIFTTNNNE